MAEIKNINEESRIKAFFSAFEKNRRRNTLNNPGTLLRILLQKENISRLEEQYGIGERLYSRRTKRWVYRKNPKP